MATPMTAKQFVTQLKKWKVNYQEYKDWETHNRAGHGAWGPVHGFMWHHTGSDSDDQRLLLYKGYSNLPGPLCHVGIAQNGTCWLIGWGRANHAGKGDSDVLEAVIDERKLPHDDYADIDANARYYGMEIWYSGSHDMTAKQYETAILVSCAINDFHGWNEGSELGHGESQPGKWDPGIRSGEMRNMDKVRADIATRQAKGPNWNSKDDNVIDPKKPAPKPQAYRDVWNVDAMAKPRTNNDEDNPYWWPETMLRHAAEQAAEANRKIDKVLKHLGLD